MIAFCRAQESGHEGARDVYAQAAQQAGYVSEFIPVLQFEFEEFSVEVQNALSSPQHFAGLIFTSKQAVKAAQIALNRVNEDARQRWESMPIFTVGKATAGAAKGVFDKGNFPCFGAGTAAKLGQDIVAHCVSGKVTESTTLKPMLFICSNKARHDIDTALSSADIPFRRLVGYSTVQAHDAGQRACDVLSKSSQSPKWVVLFSPSSAETVLPDMMQLEKRPRLAAIGPTTADAINSGQFGDWTVSAVGEKPTPESLLEAVLAFDHGI